MAGRSGSMNATSLLGLQLGNGNHAAACERLAREPANSHWRCAKDKTNGSP